MEPRTTGPGETNQWKDAGYQQNPQTHATTTKPMSLTAINPATGADLSASMSTLLPVVLIVGGFLLTVVSRLGRRRN